MSFHTSIQHPGLFRPAIGIVILLVVIGAAQLWAGSIPISGTMQTGFSCDSVACWSEGLSGVGTEQVIALVSVETNADFNGPTGGSVGDTFHGFTTGPIRPGIMSLWYSVDTDRANFGGLGFPTFLGSGSVDSLDPPVPSLFTFSCSGGCASQVNLPIQLGVPFDVNLAAMVNAPERTWGSTVTAVRLSIEEAQVPESSSFTLISGGLCGFFALKILPWQSLLLAGRKRKSG